MLNAREESLFTEAPFDFLSLSVIDFSQGRFKTSHYSKREISSGPYYDLASVSKPLINGLIRLKHPNLFNEERKLLLNHRGGLPAWGRLSQKNWKQQIIDYSISESDTLYSDFSSLRLMLELEEDIDIKNEVSCFYEGKLQFWKNNSSDHFYPETGVRNGGPISGVVNDDNAFVINDFVSHTGLFSRIEDLCWGVLKLEEELSLIDKVSEAQKKNNNRFNLGWDRVENTNSTLAGKGCSEESFGHLGFTGTGIWIDPIKRIGYALLTNATQSFWFQRKQLNLLRKSIGERVWKGELWD